VTGLEAAAAAAAKAVAQKAVREWLAARASQAEREKDLSELMQVSFPDRFVRRRLGRQIEDIADSVERRLGSLIAAEYGGLTDGDRAAVFAEASLALERADLSDSALLLDDLDPGKLAQRVRAGMPSVARELGEPGARLFDVVLDECCDCLVRIIRQLPQFAPRAAAEALGRLSGIGDQVAVVLDRLPVRTLDAPDGTRNDADFERRYLEHLSETLDAVELFGVRVETYRPRVGLSAAYITLSVTAEVWAAPDPGFGPLKFATLTGAPEARTAVMRAETALARFPRTLLRGQAGSGKSTLLRWIAVTAARSGFTGDLGQWNGKVPFLVKLRSYASGPLPQPEGFVTGPLAGLMPSGWAHRVLGQGRALLLVDGVDEVPLNRRGAVRQWLRELLAAYPQVRAVVASRPAAAEGRWLAAEGFSPLILEPMGPVELRELVRQWHLAIRHAPGLPCRPEELPGYEGALLARLEGGAHLRALAATPLLAAMMCALNLDRATHLPRDRMGLYAAVLDLLLERRDAERGIAADAGGTLEREQKARILQDLAWQLTIFGRTEMAHTTATKVVAGKIAGMPRITAAPEAVLEHLLQRSGVIREPVPGRIDFTHRTVQEYLAAAQAADNADAEPLIARAHLDQWHETIIMTAGHANAPLRRQLLAGLLDRADAEHRHATRLRLLVAACLETIHDVPADLQDRINTCVDSLIPPRSTADARPLASAGDQVLSRLPATLASLPTGEAVATVRTAWLVHGSRALDHLARYASDPRPRVQDEIISAWSYFDPQEYARRVLAEAPLHDGRLTIDDPKVLAGVPHLRNLSDLRVSLPDQADLDCLRGLRALTTVNAAKCSAAAFPALAEHPGLRAITFGRLDGPVDDLSPLFALPALRAFNAYGGQFTCDLRFLHRLPQLTELSLPGLQETEDFTPLSAQPSVTHLYLTQCANLRGIGPLRHMTRLRRLSLINASLRAGSIEEIVQTWPRLQWLQVTGTDCLTDLAPVTTLPLKVLAINDSARLASIEPIARLRELQHLYCVNVKFPDLTPLAGLTKLHTLNVSGCEGAADLTPLAGLPSLRRLFLTDMPEEADVTPLAAMRDLTISIFDGQHIKGAERLHKSARIERMSRH